MSRDGLSICAHFQGQKNVTDLLTDGFKLNLHLSERQSKTESRVIRFCWHQPEDGSSKRLRKVSTYIPIYMVSYPIRQ